MARYGALLHKCATLLDDMAEPRRLRLLLELIDPLVRTLKSDEFADLPDETDAEMEFAAALAGLRAVAAGENADVETIHESLVAFAWAKSESDSQNADAQRAAETVYLAARWLEPWAGSVLPVPEELAAAEAWLHTTSRLVNVVAWTRAEEPVQLAEYADVEDFSPALAQLEAMEREILLASG